MEQFVYLEDPATSMKAEVQLGDKVLRLPFYGVSIKSNIDSECLRDAINSMSLKNTQCVSYTMGDAQAFKNLIMKTVFEFTSKKLEFRPFSEFILVIDPTGEYIAYNVDDEVKKLLDFPDIPSVLKDILETSGKKRVSLIDKMFTDGSALSSVVQWYMDKFKDFGSVLKIPPCLPIYGKKTLKYAISVNRLASTIQNDRGWQKSVYFLIDFSAFKKPEILTGILTAIRTLAPNIVVFKVYNPDFCKDDATIERSNLQAFLENLYQYRVEKKALTFALNADAVGYHYIAQGLGGMIEPISGNYRPDIRRQKKSEKIVKIEEDDSQSTNKCGRYPDPLKLYEVKSDELKIRSKNNGAPFPCHCHECSKYDKFVTDASIFNRLRRRHRVFIRDKFIDEFNEASLNGNLKVSIFDRFSESPSMSKFGVFYS